MTNSEEKIRTIASPSHSLFKDRGSKFLGYSFPISSLDDVKERINEVKKVHPKATHHCYAFRLGHEGINFRANDDGEPSGSAGRPILGQIDSLGLTNVLVVIVRYYGGTMLGVPGLINAYKTATAEALNTVSIIEKWITQCVEITTNYPNLGEVLYWLKHYEAEVKKQDLSLFCVITAAMPKINLKACSKHLNTINGLTLKNAEKPC